MTASRDLAKLPPLNAFTTTSNGLVPAPATSSGRFLRDDGSWASAGGSSTTVFFSDTDLSVPTTTMVNALTLTGLSAQRWYKFNSVLRYRSSATSTGISVQLKYGDTAELSNSVIRVSAQIAAGGTAALFNNTILSSSGGSNTITVTTPSSRYADGTSYNDLFLEGMFCTNNTTSDVILQVASEVAGSALTVKTRFCEILNIGALNG